MPRLADKITIADQNLDKRRKLTDQDREAIRRLFFDASYRTKHKIAAESISQRKVAKMFGVTKNTIAYILYPERLERNNKLRLARGGWRLYYSKEKNTEYQRKHRQYKMKLLIEGKLDT